MSLLLLVDASLLWLVLVGAGARSGGFQKGGQRQRRQRETYDIGVGAAQ